MDVSVIMINYNTYELTKNALNSLFTYTVDLEYEIILVDNQSPDGSGDRLADEFGNRIKYIQSGGNLGTSKAFNLGFKNSCGKYILWLNTDIIIKDNFIFKLFKYMESHPECGVCGGNLLGFNGKPTHSFRKKYNFKDICKDASFLNICYRKFLKKITKRALSYEYNYTSLPQSVSYITGADLMIRRSVFNEIGLFDESFFMYCEEAEYQYRVRKYTDYSIISIPNAIMWHLEGASGEKGFSKNKYRIQLSSIVKYIEKCYGKSYCTKYLKVKKRGYIIPYVLSVFTFKKNKIDELKFKINTIEEFMLSYCA